MQLDQLNYRPGDIVRNRKNNMDYVVESIGGMSLGAGLVITGIALLNDRVDQWQVHSEAEMIAGHIVLHRNQNIVHPSDVRHKFQERIDELLHFNKDAIEQLTNDSNLGLRDLLIYGVSSEVDESQFMNQALINLTESLVTMTGKVPDKHVIANILKENASPSVTPAAIEAYAENLHQYAKSVVKTNQFLNSKSVVEDVLTTQGGQMGGDAFTLMRGLGRRFSEHKGEPIWSNLKGILLVGQNEIDEEIFGTSPSNALGERFSYHSTDRIRRLAEEMFKSRNGGKPLSDTTNTFISSLAQSVVDVAEGKMKDTDPRNKPASLLLDAIANWLLDGGPKRSAARLRASFPNLTTYAAAQIGNVRKARMFSFADKAKADLHFQEYKSTYSRSSGIRTKESSLSLLKLMDIERIERASKRPETSTFAISKDAFYNTVVGSARLKIGTAEGKYTQQNIRNELAKISDGSASFLITTAKELAIIKKLVAGHRDGSNTDAIDLTGLVDERIQQERRSGLDGASHLALKHNMIDLANGTGTEAIMPLKSNSNTSAVFQIQTDTFEHVFTADVNTVEKLLNEDPTRDLSAFGVDTRDPESAEAFAHLLNVGRESNHNSSLFVTLTNLRDRGVSKGPDYWRREMAKEKGLTGLMEHLRNRNSQDVITQFSLGRNSWPAIKGSGEMGYNETKLALASIKNGDSLAKLSFIGSDVAVPIQEQVKRGNEFLEGRGVILDIESYKNPLTNLGVVKELAIGSSETDMLHLKESKFLTPEARANSIIELTDNILHHLSTGKTVIGTAGPHDFNTLVENAHSLTDELEGANIDEGKKRHLIDRLDKAVTTLSEVRENNLFDIQVMYRMAGIPEGSTNQASVTSKLFGATQKHTAKQDVLDAIKALDVLKKNGSFKNNEVNFNGESLVKEGIYYFNTDANSPKGPGLIKKITGTANITDKNGKEKFVIQYHLHELENNKLKATSRTGTEEFESAKLAAFTLENNSMIFTKQQLEKDASIGTAYRGIVEETIGRRVRAYNPASLSLWDPLGMWDSKMHGPYAAFRLANDATTVQLFPLLQASMEQEADKLRVKHGDNLTNAQLLSVMEKADSKIDKIIEHHRKSIIAKGTGMSDIQNTGLEYVRLQLKDILTDHNNTATEYTDPTSYLTKFLKSEAGQRLTPLARLATGQELVDGWAHAPEDKYGITHMLYSAAAAEKADTELKASGRVNDFYRETNPRLALRIGDATKEMYLRTADDLSANKLGHHLDELSAMAVFQGYDKLPERARETILNMGIDEKRYNELLDEFKASKGDGSFVPDLEHLKEMTKSLAFWGDDNQFKDLKRVRVAIRDSHSAEAIVGAVKEKVAKVKAFHELEVSYSRTNDSKPIDSTFLQKALKLEEDITTLIPKSGESFEQAASNLFSQHIKENGDTLFNILKDRRLEVPDIAKLSKEDLDRSDTERDELLSYFQEHLAKEHDGVDEQVLLADSFFHARTVKRAEIGSYEYYAAGRNRLRQIKDLHMQGNAFKTIVSKEAMTAGYEMKSFHKQIADGVAAVGRTGGSAAGDEMEQTARLVLESGGIKSASQIFSKVSVPLLALGGLVGFLAAKEPNTGSPFHQGFSNNYYDKEGGNINAIEKFSEIPGDPDKQEIWYGSSDPFRLDMSFTGFINDRMQHQSLQRDVYNILDNHVDIRRNSGEVEDRRNRTHHMAAREAMKGM